MDTHEVTLVGVMCASVRIAGSVSTEAYLQCLGNQHACPVGTTARDTEVVYVAMSSCGPNR